MNTTIARKTVEEKEIPTKSLPKPFDVYNLDRSRNKENTIKEFVSLEINSNRHIKQINAVVSEIKEMDLFLGHDWLVEHNLEVDWKERVIQCYATRAFSVEKQHGIKIITLDFTIGIHSRDLLQAPDIIQTQDWVLLLSSD